MSSGIQLDHGQYVGQRVIIRVHCEGVAIKALLETFGNSPFQCKEFQLMGWVMRFTCGKSLTSIPYHLIGPILPLIEDATQDPSSGIGV